jgi:hypothetical protein
MFILKLFDRKGIELQLGDIVKISNGRHFNFFAEVKYLEEEKAITPFHTFSFHSFEKVERVPDEAIKSTETRYNIWYLPDPEEDSNSEIGEKYLMDWRACEHQLKQKCFQITLEL